MPVSKRIHYYYRLLKQSLGNSHYDIREGMWPIMLLGLWLWSLHFFFYSKSPIKLLENVLRISDAVDLLINLSNWNFSSSCSEHYILLVRRFSRLRYRRSCYLHSNCSAFSPATHISYYSSFILHPLQQISFKPSNWRCLRFCLIPQFESVQEKLRSKERVLPALNTKIPA